MNRPTFKERTWADRKGGDFFDHSEIKFEELWVGPFARFGLGPQTEGMATYKTNPFLSHAPDYLAALTPESTPILVEVQGTGLGGAEDGVITHKFKQKKLDALSKWNSTAGEVTFWLWDETTRSGCWTSYVSIRGMVAQGKASSGMFDGKRPYWSIPVDVVIADADTERLRARYG